MIFTFIFLGVDCFLVCFGIYVDQDTENLEKTSSHCLASEKSFSVMPPSSWVLSVNVTLSNRTSISCKRRLKSAAGGARKVLHLPGKADWI